MIPACVKKLFYQQEVRKMPEHKNPTFISVVAMLRLMRKARYMPRSCRMAGSNHYTQLAEPIHIDGSLRPGPVYQWSIAQGGWTYLREQV